jgi:hypothetical protein
MQASLRSFLSRDTSPSASPSPKKILSNGRNRLQNTWSGNSTNNEEKKFNPEKKFYKNQTKKSLPPKPPERRKTLEDIELEKIDDEPIGVSYKQYEVLEAILKQQSVFFTGAAGTGFSLCLSLCLSLSLSSLLTCPSQGSLLFYICFENFLKN